MRDQGRSSSPGRWQRQGQLGRAAVRLHVSAHSIGKAQDLGGASLCRGNVKAAVDVGPHDDEGRPSPCGRPTQDLGRGTKRGSLTRLRRGPGAMNGAAEVG